MPDSSTKSPLVLYKRLIDKNRDRDEADRQIWVAVRRGLLLICAEIERRYGLHNKED